MFKELIRANDGITYESSDTVLLLDVSQDERTAEELEEAIREHYTTQWCRCAHDCCGHWRTGVGLIAIDEYKAVVQLHHSQNV